MAGARRASIHLATPGSAHAQQTPPLRAAPPPQVHRARDRATGAVVALKHMFLPADGGGALPRHVLRELLVLRTLAGSHGVVPLLDMRRQARWRGAAAAAQAAGGGGGTASRQRR